MALKILNYKNADGTYLIPTPQKIVQVNGVTQGFSSYSEPCTYRDLQLVTDMDYVQSAKSVWAGRYFSLNADTTTTFAQEGSGVLNTNTPGDGNTVPQKFRVGSLCQHLFVQF